jgi:DNA-binding transcriptional MocR family regulator
VCPSHAILADRADCGVRTVQRALRQAEHLGLVSWVERRVKAAWRWLRTSNRYFLRLPETPIASGMRIHDRAKSTNGQPDRGGECKFKKEALRELLTEAARLPDLLAIRRQTFEAKLLGGC